MNRAVRCLSAAAVAGIAVLAFASSAEAHDKAVTASCETGLSVTLTRYDASTVNTLKVTEDTVTLVSTTFGSGYTHTFPNTAKTVAHSYHVVITAGDGASFGLDQTLEIPACQTPATEVPPSTTTTGPASSTPATNPTTSLPPATSTTAATTTSQAAPVTTAASATTSPPPGTVSSVTPSTVAASLPTSSPTAAPTTTTDSTPIHETINRGAPPKALPATGAASRVLIIIGFVLLGFGLILVFGVLVGKRLKRMQP